MASRSTSGKYKANEKVHVAVRCRPMNDTERKNRIKTVVETNMKEKEIRVTCNNNQEKMYKFDKTFGPTSRQVDVYRNVVEPHISEVLAGYNCTVLAYGQTGTGKTFTMEGERSGDTYTWENDPKAGIIPRTLSQLFDRLEKDGAEFSVHVSLLEIYNELIYDLLSPTEEPLLRKIYDDSSRKGSVIVADQTEIRVLDKSEVYSILEQGAAKRRTDATLMNEFSSRSHSVFTITVHIKEHTDGMTAGEELVKIGKLNLVDLAGSENIGRSGAVDQRAREAGNINQSLLTLGRCITALVDHAPHVPYRESRLTRILQDSLGGATKTSIIATISPGLDNLEETLSTLDYASRAKNIQNKPKVNQKMTKTMLIKQYDNEIERLRRELIATREKNGICMDQKQYDAMTSRLKELESTLGNRQEELEKYQDLYNNVSEELKVKSEEYAILQEEFRQASEELKNQSHLAQIKGEHGEKTVNDGIAVVRVTDEVTNSIGLVHDKVDRLKNVEQSNYTAAQQHSTSFAKHVQSLNAEAKSLVNANSEQLHSCKFVLDSAMEKTGAFKDEMNSTMSEFDTIMDEIFSSCKRIFADALTDVKEKMNESNQCLFEKEKLMENALEKQQKKFSSKLAEMQKTTQSTLQTVADMDAMIRHQMVEHHEAISSHVDRLSGKLQAIIEETEDRENGIDAAIEAMRKQLDVVASRSANIRNLTCDVRSDANEFTSISADVKEKLEIKSEHILVKMQSNMNDVERNFEEIVEQSVKHMEDSNTTLSYCVSQAANASTGLVEDFKETGEKRNAMLENASEAESTFLTKSSKHLEDMTCASRTAISKVQESLDEVCSREKEVLVTCEEGTQQLETMTSNFCTKELVCLQPTGQTPARKTYAYPKNFRHLPSDDQILKSFHEKMKIEQEAEEERQLLEQEAVANMKDNDEKDLSSGSVFAESLCEPSPEECENVQCGGGMPFFMAGKKQTQQESKLQQRPSTKASKLPLRSTHNIR